VTVLPRPPTLKEWLHAQPYTLTLSAGFFSFFAHCGLISVLEEEGLYPAHITGASAGALIGACWASGCPARTLKEHLFAVSRADFWDPALGWGLLKGELFRALVKRVACVQRLEHCPIPVTLSVFDVRTRQTRLLTAGALAEAVYASCAVPFLFRPMRIAGRYYVDGGVRDRPGLAGAAAGSRILYHHIATRSPLRQRLVLPSLAAWRELVAVVIARLPRVGPYRLAQGQWAYERARQGLQAALPSARVCGLAGS
jgi:NTE family protein